MKHVKHVAWMLLAFILLLSFIQGQEILRLNAHSLQVVKASFDPAGAVNPVNQSCSMNDPTLNCRLRWFELVLKYRQQPLDPYDPIFGEVISCSSLQMRILRKMFPSSLTLAQIASSTYPEDPYPLYWIIEITDPGISAHSKPLIEKILSIDPSEGVAWRYLGIIYLIEGNIPAAIDAHINSCLNGDPGVNGCITAGALFEQIGENDKALYYYRLSRWIKSQEAADKLEASLNEK